MISFLSLTVKWAYPCNVIRVKLHIRNVASIVGVHDCTFDVGVFQTEWMPKFMGGNPQQICSPWLPVCVCFIFVKMGAAVRGEVRVCQNPTRAVECTSTCSLSTGSSVSSGSKTKIRKGKLNKLTNIHIDHKQPCNLYVNRQINKQADIRLSFFVTLVFIWRWPFW